MLQIVLTALTLLAAFFAVPLHASCVDSTQVCLEESSPAPVAVTEPLPAESTEAEPVLADTVEALVAGITVDMKSRRLMRPRGNNALNKVRRLRQIAPDHDYSLNGERYIARVYLSLARSAIKLGDISLAEQRLKSALKLDKRVEGKQQVIESIVAAGKADAGAAPTPVPDKPRYTSSESKDTGSDSTEAPAFVAPVMVAIPAGKFVMGSEAGAEDEKPMHEVTIEAFSMSKFEITLEQYRVYAIEHGLPAPQYQTEDSNRPVTNVSWEDAQDYTRWLSTKTGKMYRLATEAEWEYAARAGAVTPYSTGEDLLDAANCIGCGSEWDGKQSAPVGSFAPNEFGLYDMHGNVWEWVQDCWTDSYFGRGDNSAAIMKKNCDRFVVRGGSWANEADYARASYRGNEGPKYRHHTVGFRVVHEGL